MSISRRNFVALAATSAAFGGLSRAVAQDASAYRSEVPGYGPLVPDPKGVFDLPEGFTYDVVSEAGQLMDDGLVTPQKMDGMGCFPAGPGRVALVRNHELKPSDPERTAFGPGRALAGKVAADKVYDRTDDGLPMGGGTSSLVWDLKARKLVTHHLSLAGTHTNCAGGITPYGTWLTCEETVQRRGEGGARDHGYVFEVPSDLRGLADPVPITGMGRFKHEATATDPRTGIVYQTEDQGDGLFYRFLPHNRERLHEGGRLQALGLRGRRGANVRNWDGRPFWRSGDWYETVWIDLDGVDSQGDDLRRRGEAKGAAVFARGEGLWFGDGEMFFTCTTGGPGQLGQIMRYAPSPEEGRPGEVDKPGRLQLFVEPHDPAVMMMGDNLAVAPTGHLFVCEDKYKGHNQLKGVTPEGKVYVFGRNAATPAAGSVNTELAGVCFSPDASTMFVNLYLPGTTLAITGPWGRLKT
jgi:secreted PhoX family phosphatase